jgi:hypothetical protein
MSATGDTSIPSVEKIWPGGEAGEPLQFMGGTWALLGRMLLVTIGQLLIIPSPWTTTSFYRWFVEQIRLPFNRQAAFIGKPTDIWWVFMLNALFSYSGVVHDALPLLGLVLTSLFYLLIMRWFFRNLVWQGGGGLNFTGNYWGLLGWSVFAIVAIVSVIGWAWVMTAMLRWVCRHVEGSGLKLSYIASGWGLLWRSVLFAIGCGFIIPIPWVLRWYTGWTVSQFCLSPRVP